MANWWDTHQIRFCYTGASFEKSAEAFELKFYSFETQRIDEWLDIGQKIQQKKAKSDRDPASKLKLLQQGGCAYVP